MNDYNELCERALVNINAILARTFRTGFYYDISYSPLGTSLMKRYEDDKKDEILVHTRKSYELFDRICIIQDVLTDVENRLNFKDH